MFKKPYREGDKKESGFSMQIIGEILKQAGRMPVCSNGSIRMPAGTTETVIIAKPVRASTIDSAKIANSVTVISEFPELCLPMITERAALLNTFAGLSALICDPKTGRVFSGSRLTTYEGDDSACGLYVALVSLSALLHVNALCQSINKVFTGNADSLNLPEGEGASKWSTDELKETCAALEQVGVVSSSGPSGLTAEFPWGPGAASALTGDRTSLFRLQADMPHPALGSGLFFQLMLPVSGPIERMAETANRLNLFEFEAVDAPPFFGAWCVDFATKSLAHVGFMPNLLYIPGTAMNVAAWMMARSKIARSLVDQA